MPDNKETAAGSTADGQSNRIKVRRVRFGAGADPNPCQEPRPLSPTERRKRLRRAGFAPIPVVDKSPAIAGWPAKYASNDDEIESWSDTFPRARSTGLLTRIMPALDADICNPEAAEAVEMLVRERFEEAGRILVRFGKSPKRAIPFRTEQPFKKIVVNLIAANGDEGQKIEMLADGQQLVAFGIHPDTRKRYRWFGGKPGEVELNHLPYIDEAQAQQLVKDVVELLCSEFGYERANNRKEKTGANDDIEDGGNRAGSEDWTELLADIYSGRHRQHS